MAVDAVVAEEQVTWAGAVAGFTAAATGAAASDGMAGAVAAALSAESVTAVPAGAAGSATAGALRVRAAAWNR